MTCRLHPLDGFDAEQVEAAVEGAGGEVAEGEAAGAEVVGLRFDHRAVFEELAVAAGEFEEVGGEVVRAIVGDDAVEGFGELE